MKKQNITGITLLIFLLSLFFTGYSHAETDRYKVVIEESYYTVAYENEDEFLKIYKEMLFPFWHEMKNRGIIQDDIRMYSQRVHQFKPHWSFKTVVRFTNYNSIDKWLDSRDEVMNKLFPGQGGYKTVRAKISAITLEHWDNLIRELPLE